LHKNNIKYTDIQQYGSFYNFYTPVPVSSQVWTVHCGDCYDTQPVNQTNKSVSEFQECNFIKNILKNT